MPLRQVGVMIAVLAYLGGRAVIRQIEQQVEHRREHQRVKDFVALRPIQPSGAM